MCIIVSHAERERERKKYTEDKGSARECKKKTISTFLHDVYDVQHSEHQAVVIPLRAFQNVVLQGLKPECDTKIRRQVYQLIHQTHVTCKYACLPNVKVNK